MQIDMQRDEMPRAGEWGNKIEHKLTKGKIKQCPPVPSFLLSFWHFSATFPSNPLAARQETYFAAENISLSKRPDRLPSYSSASLFSISLLHKLLSAPLFLVPGACHHCPPTTMANHSLGHLSMYANLQGMKGSPPPISKKQLPPGDLHKGVYNTTYKNSSCFSLFYFQKYTYQY